MIEQKPGRLARPIVIAVTMRICIMLVVIGTMLALDAVARAATVQSRAHSYTLVYTAPGSTTTFAMAVPTSITTTHSLAGTQGNAGWFVSVVTVTLTVQDDGTVGAATFYRIDGSDWITYTGPFSIATDGTHLLEYYSQDSSQTLEPSHIVQIRVDSMPPSASVDMLADSMESTTFAVSWSGTDNGGSGVTSYDIQYRDGMRSAWRDWLTNTTGTVATFTMAQRGHVYYFQVRAHDAAGNTEPYGGGRGDTYTFVDSVTNGDFETGSLAGWTVTGEMSKSVILAMFVGGQGQWTALLGSPDYGDAITPTEQL